eukprot:TRINITY_DN8103_c0_g1_i1.p1 TRINITY_DN8103_c0_g1~~TRINITY_DN8103_c0_g1_i1.p1  ORF type:complete len:918 (+),score=188.84 TRINITY_DN8103_c0_g1_i1:101-2755(+)
MSNDASCYIPIECDSIVDGGSISVSSSPASSTCPANDGQYCPHGANVITVSGNNLTIDGFILYVTQSKCLSRPRVGSWKPVPQTQVLIDCQDYIPGSYPTSTIASTSDAPNFGSQISLHWTPSLMTPHGDVEVSGVVRVGTTCLRISPLSLTMSSAFFGPVPDYANNPLDIPQPKKRQAANPPVCTPRLGGVTDPRNFPTSPYTLEPFVRPFAQPGTAVPLAVYTDPTTLEQIQYYEYKVVNTKISIFPENMTNIFSYETNAMLRGADGSPFPLGGVPVAVASTPAPTIKVCLGVQTWIRFYNELDGLDNRFQVDPKYIAIMDESIGLQTADDIRATFAQPWPFSVHLHGSASLAPYDGWAEDMTFTGQYKDYHYPNNRPATLWYHDHSVHVTSDNAYMGMAGQYWVEDCCSGVINIFPDARYERELVLQDKVFDANYQFMYLKANGLAHQNDLYGDHNLINGIPWPVMEVEARQYKFRVLNAAITRPFRPYLSNGATFYVVGSDGGILDQAVPVTSYKHSVAERWELVFDFTSYAPGTEIYLMNAPIDRVPMFCQSHLLLKFVVIAASAIPDVPKIDGNTVFHTQFDNLLETILPAQAIADARAGIIPPTRFLVFGRRQGQWRVNGESWETLTPSQHILPEFAREIAPNAIEVWEVRGGGGWFHPVHIHLVDFFLLSRKGLDSALQPLADPATSLFFYEIGSPKDVFALGPSETVTLISRWGPFSGDYMFHCHNLVHEDNDMMAAFRLGGPNSLDSASWLKAPRDPAVANPMWLPGRSNLYVVPRTQPLQFVFPPRPSAANGLFAALIDTQFYEIFYPRVQPNYISPWIVNWTRLVDGTCAPGGICKVPGNCFDLPCSGACAACSFCAAPWITADPFPFFALP